MCTGFKSRLEARGLARDGKEGLRCASEHRVQRLVRAQRADQMRKANCSMWMLYPKEGLPQTVDPRHKSFGGFTQKGVPAHK